MQLFTIANFSERDFRWNISAFKNPLGGFLRPPTETFYMLKLINYLPEAEGFSGVNSFSPQSKMMTRTICVQLLISRHIRLMSFPHNTSRLSLKLNN